jgi:2,5-diketo-D-gluconate reductase A
MTVSKSVSLASGRTMPSVGLGTWQLARDTAGTVELALRLGYRLIDTSGDYGTQPGVGEGIRRSSATTAASGSRRSWRRRASARP